MGLQGSLRDMAVADLIQHTCQDRKLAQIIIRHGGQQATLFFKEGNVVHAESGAREGEEVIYHILGWEEGTFHLETGVSPPRVTVDRSWSSLLLEGARRLDEAKLDEAEIETDQFESEHTIQLEGKAMATKLDETLKEMSSEINGYIGSMVVGMDGISIAQHLRGKADVDALGAQVTMLFKLVDTSVTKLALGVLEDNLLTTTAEYVLMRFLPDKQHYLAVMVERKTGSLGNMRLISKLYADRIRKAMPR